jgi:DNA (cytosine-5)-methyltransferase 1
MRMFFPRELFRAQGFPDSYEIEVTHQGKVLSKKAQVRMVGNSVSPPAAQALVMANLGVSKALGPDPSTWHPGIVASGQQMALFDLEAIA